MSDLAAADVLIPAGEIDGPLFYPGVLGADVDTRLNAYLAQGYNKATAADISDQDARDQIARIFTYYRAWSDVANRLNMQPASSALEGEGSVAFLSTQIAAWNEQRDAWKAQLDVLLPNDAPAALPLNLSQSVRTKIVF